MKSVPNLISYLHDFVQNFSQFLAICFELFSFREFVYSEIADSGPHLSGAACRDGPAWQRAVAAWPPCTAPRRRRGLKPLSGQRAMCPDSRLAHAARLPTAPCLARAAAALTASRAPLSSRPPPCRPHRRPDRAVVPTASPTAPPSRPCHRPDHCVGRGQAGPRPVWPWAAHAGRASAVHAGRAPRGRGQHPHCASGPSAVSTQWHPVKFYYFLIYSIQCEFKKIV
jgi:hypothetical protein